MKIVLEPGKCRKLLENVLLYHGGAELDSNVGMFTPEKVEFQDIDLEVLGVYASYNRDFFITYEADDEKVPFSKSLLDQMRRGFGVGEQVVLWTEDAKKIHLEGKGEKYEEPLTEVTPSDFPISFREDPTLGLVPESLEAKVQVQVEASALTGLPKAENYLFRSDGERLTVIIEDVGKYTREFTPIMEREMDSLEVEFEAGYFANAASQFVGGVWLSLSEDSAVFSQRLDASRLTYMLGSL